MSEVKISPFTFSDLLRFDVTSHHAYVLPAVWRHLLVLYPLMANSSWSWTAWHYAGFPLGSSGILPTGEAWAFFSEAAGEHLLVLTRAAREVLAMHAAVVGPVYADIDKDHANAVRWARLLGFRPHKGDQWIYEERRCVSSTTPKL